MNFESKKLHMEQQLKNRINELLISPASRDNRIDSIRGLMLVLITINHYGGWLADFVWQPIGFVSDAEGFIFISGFVLSLVYGKYLVNYNKLAVKVLHRSFTVYKYHIFLVVGILLIGFIIPLYQAYWKNINFYYHSAPVLKSCISTALLIFQPGFMDVLPLYAIFILMSWPFLILLHKGKTFLAITATLLIWLWGQFVNPTVYLCKAFFMGANPGVFNIFSWQIIFMIGVYLGFKKKIKEELSFFNNKFIKLFMFSIFMVLLFLRYNEKFNFFFLDINLFPHLYRTTLPWLRLLNFLAVLFVVSEIIKRIPERCGIPIIQFLGKHSLQVFSCHILFIYLVFIPLGFGKGVITKYGNTAYIIVLIISLMVMYASAYAHKIHMDGLKKKKQP